MLTFKQILRVDRLKKQLQSLCLGLKNDDDKEYTIRRKRAQHPETGEHIIVDF